MRNISQTSLNKIVQSEGSDPITLVQIYWTEDSYIIYGDRAFTPPVKGGLLEISEIENVINAAKGSNSGSVSIRLDDTDGHLKEIFDTSDIHKRPVYVLQWFADIPLADAFIVFDGVISTPIIWNEGDRTLSFEILSKIEDLEVGFSAEEGNFEYIPPNIVGQAWPMIFGQALHVPALQINEIPSGTTTEDTGIDGSGVGQGPIADIGEQERKNISLLQELERQCFTMAAILLGNAYSLDSETVTSSANAAVGLSGGGTTGTEATGNEQFPISGPSLSGAFYRKSDNPLAQQLYDLGTQYEELGNQYLRERMRPINQGVFNNPENQALEKNQIKISGGSKFPQKQNIIIRINGAAHEGYFEGDIFTIVSRTHPFTDQASVVAPTQVLDREVATEYKTTLAAQSFFYAVGGSSVIVDINAYPVYYIVGIPHVTVGAVLARKNGSGLTKFVVPSSYYSISFKTFGTLKVTILTMSRPLSSRIGENWQDDIWCNLTSPIGPNGVDIIQYLVEHYTNQSIDPTSFAATKTLVNPYKMGFALTERRSAMQVIGELAYMLRCALWFKGGRFYLKYLAKADTPVDTITEDDVESGTMQVTATDTEDLVTKWIVEWAPTIDKNPKNRIVYRYHIKKYGTIEETFDCYAFNSKALVEKFALFWLIRKSNTWKRLSFSTFLTKIRLEPFDTVLINFASDYVNDPGCVTPTHGVVEEARYNSENQRVELTIWLPIRFGEMCPYDFAYPGDLDTTYIFPQENDEGIETGIPGNAATGPLYDQTPLIGAGTPQTTPPNSGSGGGAFVSDQNDQAESDAGTFDPSTEIDPSVINNTATTPPTGTKEISTRTIKPIDLPVKANLFDGCYPGFVSGPSSFGPLFYDVDVYFKGLNGPSKRVMAKQLDLDTRDEIPPGTGVLVSQVVIRDDNGLIKKVEYTMQVPIWLQPEDEEAADDQPNPTPNPDEGSTPSIDPPAPEADEGDE